MCGPVLLPYHVKMVETDVWKEIVDRYVIVVRCDDEKKKFGQLHVLCAIGYHCRLGQGQSTA